MPPSPPKKIRNGLVAMSSAAILAVYSAGYTRTRAAAQRLEVQSEARIPAPVETTKPAAAPPAAVTAVAEVPPSRKHLSPSPATAPVKPPVAATHDEPAPAEPSASAPVIAAPVPSVAEVVAPAPAVPAPTLPPAVPAAPKWKDGTYLGWGTSRHGDIQASVVIANGRIQSATIAQCLTRYSCSVISQLPPEVAERQSPEVDYVSHATQSANAFYYAVVDALNKAK